LRVTGKHSHDPDTAATGPPSAWVNYLIKVQRIWAERQADGEGRDVDDEFDDTIQYTLSLILVIM